MLTRRGFLGLAAGGALAASALPLRHLLEKRVLPGQLLGPSASAGHRLRDGGAFPEAEHEEALDTVIVGGGIAGLSAAWWLKRKGHAQFRLLELEPDAGGNSRSGKNTVSAYPWGAHYLPLPSDEATYVRELLQELGAITGYGENGKPVYNEFYLCADPQERLFFRGAWQDGLVPQAGISREEHAQYKTFFARMEQYKRLRGADGRAAFAIPVDESSRDPALLSLDRISMEEFLAQNGFTSQYLRWYVNYCCRDDYGRGSAHVSAWAGVHYFAARVGEGANASPGSVLTWPEGNGWLANGLRKAAAEHIETGVLVHSIETRGDHVIVKALEVATSRPRRIRANHAVFAGPRFVANHVVQGLAPRSGDPEYAPWLVANVTLRETPKNKGVPLSWDNVNFAGTSLGYVVATHQNLTLVPTATVLTFYQPLDHLPPAEARREAQAKTHADWCKLVLGELEAMHRGISGTVQRIDSWVWGHGMVSPGVGYLWGNRRPELARPFGRVHFAHSDQSGVSIFEEAQYRGVKAAEAVLRERA